MARWMLSLGIEASRAFCTARPSAGLASTLPPPSRAATVMPRASLVKSLPRLASAAPFLCLIEDHLECPDITWHSMNVEMVTDSHRVGPGRSLAAGLIFVLMLLAALSIWTAIPLGWIYIGSKVSHTQF